MRNALTFAALFGALLVEAAAGELGNSKTSPDLAALRWLSPDADIVSHLTVTPGECLRPPETGEAAYLVETGRAAFNNPLLFGGLAARGGLSCNSCHVDGRDGPAFFVEGLSGKPGTADVTSSLFSKTREDNILNPVLIPSLVDVAGKKTFGARQPAPTLQAFIEHAVVDEFQGAPPPQRLVDSIAAYVAHLDSDYCPAGATPITIEREMDDVARILKALEAAIERGDQNVADFLILSAQNKTGVIYQRYADPALDEQRAGLLGLSSSLNTLRGEKLSAPVKAQPTLRAIVSEMETIRPVLRRRQASSFYNKAVLERVLKVSEAQ